MNPAIIVNPKRSEQPNALIAWLFLTIGILVMYVPTFLNLFQHVWNTDRQAHGPIVLAVSLWFFYFKLKSLKSQNIQISPSPLLGWSVLVVGVIMYVVGRSQGVLVFDVGSLILVLLGLILLLFGHSVARYFWFGFFFMLFVIPLPASLVDTITQPMKIAVSYCAVHLLYWLNYPAAREGVVIFIGQYQLLVADACSGLNSLFTLEALGLLYMNISRHESAFRNALLALLIIPISFASNVTRVIVLALITYHWGDEAGQGFLHEFSGLVLFLTALMIIIGVDSMLRTIVIAWKKWRNA